MKKEFNLKYSLYLKRIILTTIILLNFACSGVSLKDNSSKSSVNSYYKSNGIPELKYSLAGNQEYFRFVNDTKNGICGEDNKDYLSFYKNKNIKGHGDQSAYWRWEVSFTQDQMDAVINNNLYSLGKSKPKNVYRLTNGKWVAGSLSSNPVGKVKTVKAVKRGQSGIVMDLLIEGSKGKFVVTKENNIRRVLAFPKSSLDGTGTVKLIGKNGKTLSTGSSLFPSAFFAVEKKTSTFKIYGGGFGHGIGVPQWNVRGLVKEGKNYDDILNRYYRGADLSKASRIKGFSGDVRVGITKNSNPKHNIITLSAPDKIVLKSGWSSSSIPKNKKVVFLKSGSEVIAKVDDKIMMRSKNGIRVDSSSKIKVNSITRAVSNKNPSYRGEFEITPYGSKDLLLVNVIDLEDYLLQVVGSEMPASFGLEALKVQAVAARTYAVNGILERKYKNYNFDLMDTVASQVYNNLDEDESVNKAVKSTKGKVLTYNGEVIPTYFYSTSAGYSATPQESW